jgi:hypothetical protein
MEPQEEQVLIHIRGTLYFVHDLTLSVQQILRLGYRGLQQQKYIIFDKNRGDKVLYARKLPQPTPEEEELVEVPFCPRSTKPCRKNLLPSGTEPSTGSWTCVYTNGIHTCPHYYHIQGKVQFLETLTYVPKAYVEHPQPQLFPIIHYLRDTQVHTKRQILYDFEYDDISIYPQDTNGCVLQVGWHDQEYRDFQRYYDSEGILLTPRTPEHSQDVYFDRLKFLSTRDPVSSLQVLTVTYKLLLAYGGLNTDFFSGTEHLKSEYQVTFQDRTTKLHAYWEVRSILTLVPKTLVAHRYPHYYSTTRTDRSIDQVAEINENSTTPVIFHSHQYLDEINPRVYRDIVQGLQPGIHNQLISN